MPSQPLSGSQVWPRIITELPLEVMLGTGQQQPPSVDTRPPGTVRRHPCDTRTPGTVCRHPWGQEEKVQELLPIAGGCAATGLRSGPSSTLIKFPCGRGPLPLLHCVTWGIP